ncbi:hypothetical protein EK21DRAFT_113673 [Setomelanomma holmii]|uniref:Uncharacterized protein n=1 Tax=Setomelanomma holmii TaxID=210430 RepID=A0A9P4H7K0_9PLEO|nr:hypothetical protein EK21DRAFT_113673 [Setomelanomma holmii]
MSTMLLRQWVRARIPIARSAAVHQPRLSSLQSCLQRKIATESDQNPAHDIPTHSQREPTLYTPWTSPETESTYKPHPDGFTYKQDRIDDEAQRSMTDMLSDFTGSRVTAHQIAEKGFPRDASVAEMGENVFEHRKSKRERLEYREYLLTMAAFAFAFMSGLIFMKTLRKDVD